MASSNAARALCETTLITTMTMMLRVATYNIHKGVTSIRRRSTLAAIYAGLHSINADIVFLQEVQDQRLSNRWATGIIRSGGALSTLGAWQLDVLAGHHYAYGSYGKNVTQGGGNHHGNAILSRYPVLHWENLDISDHLLERRGLLHAEIQMPQHKLHLMCVHLGLFSKSRERQIQALIHRVRTAVPDNAPLLIAGDFNDWRKHLHYPLMHALNLQEVGAQKGPARTFPSRFPWLPLDRIYVRGATIHHSSVAHGSRWAKCSDHRPLFADLVLR